MKFMKTTKMRAREEKSQPITTPITEQLITSMDVKVQFRLRPFVICIRLILKKLLATLLAKDNMHGACCLLVTKDKMRLTDEIADEGQEEATTSWSRTESEITGKKRDQFIRVILCNEQDACCVTFVVSLAL